MYNIHINKITPLAVTIDPFPKGTILFSAYFNQRISKSFVTFNLNQNVSDGVYSPFFTLQNNQNIVCNYNGTYNIIVNQTPTTTKKVTADSKLVLNGATIYYYQLCASNKNIMSCNHSYSINSKNLNATDVLQLQFGNQSPNEFDPNNNPEWKGNIQIIQA